MTPPQSATTSANPNIGLLDDEFLAQVKNLPERNLAVELLERLLEGEIKSRFATNVVQERKFSELLVPPDLADAAVELVLEQAETIGEEWGGQ